MLYYTMLCYVCYVMLRYVIPPKIVYRYKIVSADEDEDEDEDGDGSFCVHTNDLHLDNTTLGSLYTLESDYSYLTTSGGGL